MKRIPAGFFDVDGTLCSTNIVLAYLDFRLQGASFVRRWAHLTLMLTKLPYYVVLDSINRVRIFLIEIYSIKIFIYID